MEPSLAKAEPISYGGITAVTMYLRRQKTAAGRGVGIYEGNSPSDTKISEEGGEEVP